jgi:hypothetical protein
MLSTKPDFSCEFANKEYRWDDDLKCAVNPSGNCESCLDYLSNLPPEPEPEPKVINVKATNIISASCTIYTIRFDPVTVKNYACWDEKKNQWKIIQKIEDEPSPRFEYLQAH